MINKYIKCLQDNKKLLIVSSIFMLIGLTLGSGWQAYNDVQTVNKLLSDNADTTNLLTDGNNYYKVITYNLTEFDYEDYLYGNITFLNESCECDK